MSIGPLSNRSTRCPNDKQVKILVRINFFLLGIPGNAQVLIYFEHMPMTLADLFAPPPPALGELLASLTPPAPRWAYVRPRFQRFLANLDLTTNQFEDGEIKWRGVVACLNRAYWNENSETAHCQPAGSWGKGTRVRPPRDIDFLFQLPATVYYRYQNRAGNRQSQLLQEVREKLLTTYPATRIRGDGQVVVVPFGTYELEVVPAFAREGGGYFICETSGDGHYKWVDPVSEIAAVDFDDRRYNGNVRKLVRIFKQWQRYCNVPLKSFHIEALIMEALQPCIYAGWDEWWFDWLVRDALYHFTRRANGYFIMPVTGEVISLGDQWLSKAQTALVRACKACDCEYTSDEEAAGEEWQKIFGTVIPRKVT